MKPSTAKAKGAATEEMWVQFLRANGVPNAERRHLAGRFDKGDISGWSASDGSWNVCNEVKSGAVLNIQEWLRELDAEMKNAASEMGAVVVRPKGKPDPEDWFIVMPARLWMDLMDKAKYLNV
jgi:hypothetical protein